MLKWVADADSVATTRPRPRNFKPGRMSRGAVSLMPTKVAVIDPDKNAHQRIDPEPVAATPLEPGQELREAVYLVVVASLRKLQQFKT